MELIRTVPLGITSVCHKMPLEVTPFSRLNRSGAVVNDRYGERREDNCKQLDRNCRKNPYNPVTEGTNLSTKETISSDRREFRGAAGAAGVGTLLLGSAWILSRKSLPPEGSSKIKSLGCNHCFQ